MSDFKKVWDKSLEPALVAWVTEAANRLSETRGERFSVSSGFFPRSEFDSEHATVVLTTREDTVTPRTIQFTVYSGQQADNYFYKLFWEAFTSFDQEEPVVVEFEDDLGRPFKCKFYRNAESLKLRIEDEYLDKVFRSADDLLAAIAEYPLSVFHDILNAALNTLIEEANAITARFATAGEGEFNINLSEQHFLQS